MFLPFLLILSSAIVLCDVCGWIFYVLPGIAFPVGCCGVQMHSCETEEGGQLGSVFFLGEVSSSLGSHNGEMIRRSIFLLISLCRELIHFSCQRLMLMSPEEGVLV